jgi:hypothetical protein
VVKPGGVERIFLVPPPGTTTWAVTVRPSRGKPASILAAIYDGGGHRLPRDGMVSSQDGREVLWTLSNSDLGEGGTFELDLVGALVPAVQSTVDVQVRFGGLEAAPVGVLRADPGKAPAADIMVANRLSVPFDGEVNGEIRGYERTFSRQLEGDFIKHGFTTSTEIEAVEFDLEMSPQDWNRFTDVAVNILDKEGRAAVQTGFSNRKLTVVLKVPPAAGSNDWNLEIRAGRAVRGGPSGEVKLTERFVTRERVALVGSVEGSQRVRLWPTVQTKVRMQAVSTPKAPASGTLWSGSVDFIDRRDGSTWLRLPIRAAP